MNPERPAIDINGHDLQPREQPYVCIEIEQGSDGDIWVDKSKYPAAIFIQTRLAYQSIEDAVKVEKETEHPLDWFRRGGHLDTPVNEAKEVEIAQHSYNQRFFEAVTDYEKKFHSGYVMGFINGYNYRATHHIENKERVKKAIEKMSDLDTYVKNMAKLLDIGIYTPMEAFEHGINGGLNYSDDKLQEAINEKEELQRQVNTLEKEAAQFTPIEQGKRMVSVDIVEAFLQKIASMSTSATAEQNKNIRFEILDFTKSITNQKY